MVAKWYFDNAQAWASFCPLIYLIAHSFSPITHADHYIRYSDSEVSGEEEDEDEDAEEEEVEEEAEDDAVPAEGM